MYKGALMPPIPIRPINNPWPNLKGIAASERGNPVGGPFYRPHRISPPMSTWDLLHMLHAVQPDAENVDRAEIPLWLKGLTMATSTGALDTASSDRHDAPTLRI